MPALPVIDSQQLARGLAEVSHVIVRRGVDHTVLETLAVSELHSDVYRLVGDLTFSANQPN